MTVRVFLYSFTTAVYAYLLCKYTAGRYTEGKSPINYHTPNYSRIIP